MKLLKTLFFAGILFLASCQQSKKDNTIAATSDGGLDRTVLPIQPPKQKQITEMDARNVEKPASFEIKAPDNAPNVVVVLIDDIGFVIKMPSGMEGIAVDDCDDHRQESECEQPVGEGNGHCHDLFSRIRMG